MGLASKLRVLAKEDLTRVHEATVKVLEQTGVGFHSEAAIAIFKEHGAKVNGDVVYIPRAMLEKALETTPSSFTWWGLNESKAVVLGGDQERTHISPNSGPVYIQDLDKGRRLGTIEDVANIYKLCQHSDIVNVVGHIPVDPHDVPVAEKHVRVFQQLLNHSDKPIIGYPGSKKQVLEMFSMLEMAVGQDYLLKHPMMGVSINPLSPLRYDKGPAETMIEYAKRGQVVFTLSCALAGISAPVSLLGSAVMQNAEMLAGLVLTQLVNPGNPFIISPASTVPNFKKGSYITGSPEANLINIINLQMALELYNIPCRSMAGLTDAKLVDCQAGYETMQNLFMLMLGGAHIINECVGVLDSIMTTSYEKFIIDEEMMSRILRFMQGVDTSDEALAVDLIHEIGQSGSYLMHPSTFAHFRESWSPTVSDWDSFADWQEQGSEDVVVRANRKYKEILGAAPATLIDEQLSKDLEKFIVSLKLS